MASKEKASVDDQLAEFESIELDQRAFDNFSPSGSRREQQKSRSRKHQKDEQHRKQKNRHSNHSSVLLSAALMEEERFIFTLKESLQNMEDRLQRQNRRAEDAEHHGETIAVRLREAHTRIHQLEASKIQADLELVRAHEETARYKLQLEVAEREMRRAEDDIRTTEKQRDEAEKDAARSRQKVREYEQTIRESNARQEGRQEGRKVGLSRGYSDGHIEGQDKGRAEGYEEGLTRGREEGRQRGYTEGRSIERKHAYEAFDKFLANNGWEGEEDNGGNTNSEDNPMSSKTRPAPDDDQRSKTWYTAPSKPMWLHRPLNNERT